METNDILFVLQMAAVVAGLVLMGATLLQFQRGGGFEQAMASTADGKIPVSRVLLIGALFCFAIATFILFLDLFD